MSEPLKPRIDFDGPLQAEKTPPLKSARAFDRREADNFAPALLVTGEEEEGAAEAVVESVLRPKRSLWRRMVSAGLAIFGVSVVAQGVQWTANAWQTQDWIALGGCVAGALIVGAGRPPSAWLGFRPSSGSSTRRPMPSWRYWKRW